MVQKLLVVVYFVKLQLMYSVLLFVYLILPEHTSSASDVYESGCGLFVSNSDKDANSKYSLLFFIVKQQNICSILLLMGLYLPPTGIYSLVKCCVAVS